MSRQYYYFIAGLPSISLDDTKLGYSPEQFREDAKAQLSDADWELLLLLHLMDEFPNLLAALYKQNREFPNESLFPETYWQDFLGYQRQKLDNNALPCPDEYRWLPDFVSERILEALALEEMPEYQNLEHQLFCAFFDYTGKHQNGFVQQWFEHERELRNILAAINGRNHGIAFAEYLIGSDETAQNLAKSHASDFGLGKDHPLFDPLLRIWEQNNILFREKGYDVLRSKWIDNHNFFEYFNIDRILGYYSKLRLISRWIKADPDLGKEIFQDTLDALENSFGFPEDFNIKIKQK